jgi:hypothetical protein
MIFETEFFVKLDTAVFNPDFDMQEKNNLNKAFRMYFDQPVTEKSDQPSDSDKGDEPVYRIVKYVSAEHLKAFENRDGIYQVVAFLINSCLQYPQNVDIQKISLNVLSKLYFNFPKY